MASGTNSQRRAEIVGAGFAGLAAACALARRGWRVRVHERSEALRTAGAGIYVYENGLRVLEALGAYEAGISGAPRSRTREIRDDANNVIGTHHWPPGARVFSVVRQQLINALADAARGAGAEIVTGSEAVAARPSGELVLADGRTLAADLIVAGDGVNSRIRDCLGLTAKRRYLPDGAIRMLIDKSDADAGADPGTTIEYWSGTRRILYTPCSDTQVYIAMTMLHSDEAAKAVPVQKADWTRWFPHLAALIQRLDGDGRYDRFEYIRLKSWSAGRVAVIGDAAHALPPNIGQGGGCAMMNALSMAVYLERGPDIESALAAWEKAERPLTEHTQRISLLLGMPTTWHPLLRRMFFAWTSRSRWLTRQRTRTARHIPTGTGEAAAGLQMPQA